MTLCMDTADAKCYKQAKINGGDYTVYVNFGSACNTIRQSAQKRLMCC